MTKLCCTVLGCGTSAGVPSLGFGWGVCDPDNPKNRRMRCSLLLQWKETGTSSVTAGSSPVAVVENDLLRSVLIDSSPDCLAQLMGVRLKRLDAVLYTHGHADHCHGIDDLKWMRDKTPIPAYAARTTITSLTRRFGYIFTMKKADDLPLYRPVLAPHAITPFRAFCPIMSEGEKQVGCDLLTPTILPITLDHGFGTSVLGFRIGDFAYTTDCVDLSERAFDALAGVRRWVVGCLRREQHPTHAHLARVVSWVEHLRVERTYLTHMNGSMDYKSLCAELPSHIRPAHDFLRIEAEFQ